MRLQAKGQSEGCRLELFSVLQAGHYPNRRDPLRLVSLNNKLLIRPVRSAIDLDQEASGAISLMDGMPLTASTGVRSSVVRRDVATAGRVASNFERLTAATNPAAWRYWLRSFAPHLS